MKKYLLIAIIILGGVFITQQKANASVYWEQLNQNATSSELVYFGGTYRSGGQTFTSVVGNIHSVTIKLAEVSVSGDVRMELRTITNASSTFFSLSDTVLFGTSTDISITAGQTGDITFYFNDVLIPPLQAYFMRIHPVGNTSFKLKGSSSNNFYGDFFRTDGFSGLEYYYDTSVADIYFVMVVNYGFDEEGNPIYYPVITNTTEISALQEYFNSSSSPFYVDCSAYDSDTFLSARAWGCTAKQVGGYVLTALIMPPDFTKNFFLNGVEFAKSKPPFSFIYQTIATVSSTIYNANATSTDELALNFPAPWNKITIYTSSTLNSALGTSTKNMVFKALESLIWLGTGVSAIAMFL